MQPPCSGPLPSTQPLPPPPPSSLPSQAALCELLGAGASYGYLLLLFRDVDALQPGDRLPMVEAGEVQPQLAQNLAKWLASYR